MDVLFYDRKNKRQVKLSELVWSNCQDTRLSIDSEEYNSGEWQQNKHKAYLRQVQTSELGYKTDSCPDYMNYDIDLMQSDLVFLEIIDDPVKNRAKGR